MKMLKDIESIPKQFLTACDVSGYIGCDPNMICWQAHNESDKLGFPVVVIGSRVKIPKQAFIKFMRGEL